MEGSRWHLSHSSPLLIPQGVTFKATNEGRFTMPRRNQKPVRPVRVRSKRLSEIDETKLALAFWLMAKRMLDEEESAEDGAP
jgi:hypothetical protein